MDDFFDVSLQYDHVSLNLLALFVREFPKSVLIQNFPILGGRQCDPTGSLNQINMTLFGSLLDRFQRLVLLLGDFVFNLLAAHPILIILKSSRHAVAKILHQPIHRLNQSMPHPSGQLQQARFVGILEMVDVTQIGRNRLFLRKGIQVVLHP